jgi:hypothetical protein
MYSFESYLDLDNFNRNILIRFRISALNLEIEKGRHPPIIALFVAFFPTLIEQLHILKCAFSAIRSLQTLEK